MPNTTAQITNSVERTVEAQKIIALDYILLEDRLKALVTRYEGKKIVRVNGQLIEKFRVELYEILDSVKGTIDLYKGIKMFNTSKRIWVESCISNIQLRFNYWVSFGEILRNGVPDYTDGSYYEINFVLLSNISDGKAELSKAVLEGANIKRCNDIIAEDYNRIKAVKDQIKELEEHISQLKSTIPYYAYKN